MDVCQKEDVQRLSEDHKPQTEVARIRQKGGTQRYKRAVLNFVGWVFDNRVNGSLGVSRAFGDFFLDQLVICEPTTSEFKIPSNKDCFVLLCCDGVWDELDDSQACSVVLDYVKKTGSYHAAAEALRYPGQTYK